MCEQALRLDWRCVCVSLLASVEMTDDEERRQVGTPNSPGEVDPSTVVAEIKVISLDGFCVDPFVGQHRSVVDTVDRSAGLNPPLATGEVHDITSDPEDLPNDTSQTTYGRPLVG